MATTLDITLLSKTDSKGRARYNAYQLLQNDTQWGVVTRSGRFNDDGSPKLSLISGKFHDSEDKARKAYTSLIEKQRSNEDITDGDYSFDPDSMEEWEALRQSVEKRQEAAKRRRAAKRSEEQEPLEQQPEEQQEDHHQIEKVPIIQIEDPHLFDKQKQEQEQEEQEQEEQEQEEQEQEEQEEEQEQEQEQEEEVLEPPRTPKSKKKELKTPDAPKRRRKKSDEDSDQQSDEEHVPDEPADPEKKTKKRKGGRKAIPPANFTDGQEEWQKMSVRERRDWKKENPIEEE